MFQFLQSLHIRSFQATVLGFPLVVGGGTDPVLPPDLIDRATGVSLFQNGDNLRFSELRLANGNLPAEGDYCAKTFSLLSVVIYRELTMRVDKLLPFEIRCWDPTPLIYLTPTPPNCPCLYGPAPTENRTETPGSIFESLCTGIY